MQRFVAVVALGIALGAGAALAQEPKKPDAPQAPAAPKTLDEVKADYKAYEQSEREYWDFMNTVYVEEREIIKQLGVMKEAKDAAAKDSQNKELAQKAQKLEAEVNARIAKHTERRNEYETRNRDHIGKLRAIFKGIDDLERKTPDDPKVKIFRVRFIAEQGGWADLVDPPPGLSRGNLPVDEPEVLYRENPNDLEARVVYGESRLVLPFDTQPRAGHPPRHRNPRPPLFDKAYEALAPLAKGELKTASGQPLYADDQARRDGLQLAFGVAACALGKDAEAKAALDSIANIASLRPAFRSIIGTPDDPDYSFDVWKSCASGLAANPNDAALHRKRAEQLLLVLAPHYALPDAQAAAKALPDDREAQLLLARCYTSSNEFETAATLYKQIVDKLPKEEPKPTEPKPGERAPAPFDLIRAEYGMALYCSNRMADAKAALGSIVDSSKLDPRLMERLRSYQPDALVDKWAAEEKARAEDAKRDDNPRVVLETERGNITIELFEDTAPNSVANFVWLGENGFYDGTCFHRVIAGFMIQGGDPTGTGIGSCGYNVKDELKDNPRLHWRGTLSMANTGRPDSGNSQFFICHEPTPHLNGKHTVFGRVIDGQDVVDAIQVRDRIKKFTVVRKRKHDYKPEQIPVSGLTPWKPGEPRMGDKH